MHKYQRKYILRTPNAKKEFRMIRNMRMRSEASHWHYKIEELN